MTLFPKIHVCGVAELENALRNPFSHIVSIWDPEWIERGGVENQLRERLSTKTRLHVAYFHDTSVEEPGRRAPMEDDLRRILAFASDLEPGAEILVHCWAGISRSTAVAYAILCQTAGPGRESECIESVLAVRPQAFPTPLSSNSPTDPESQRRNAGSLRGNALQSFPQPLPVDPSRV